MSQQDILASPTHHSAKGGFMFSDKVNRKLELLRKAREVEQARAKKLAEEVDDNIEDFADAVLDGSREIKDIPPSVTNRDIIDVKGQKKYSAALEHAIELLGKKVPASQVCTICSISASYLHEMMQDEHFMGRIVAIQTTKLKKQSERDDRYDKIEDKLLERLESQICGLVSAAETAKVLKIINSAVRRGAGEVNNDVTNIQNVVELTLPPHLLKLFAQQHEVVLNDNNEVVSVSGTTLGRMDSTKLLNHAEAEQIIEDAEYSVKQDQVVKVEEEDNFEDMDPDELRSML